MRRRDGNPRCQSCFRSGCIAASALLALEVNNNFLLEVRQKGTQPIAALNNQLKMVQLQSTERLKVALNKLLGKLQSRFTKAKGGTARRKIKEGKTKIIVQESDVVDVASVRKQLQETEVRGDICNIKIIQCQ